MINTVDGPSGHDHRTSSQGFTLIDSFVVIAILVGMLLPALSKAKAKAQDILCVNSTKQLMLVWKVYAGDHQGKLVNNFDSDPCRLPSGRAVWAAGTRSGSRIIRPWTKPMLSPSAAMA